MMKAPYILVLTLLMLNPAWVSAGTSKWILDEDSNCTAANAPLLDIADFDGNGVVNSKDIRMLSRLVRKNAKLTRKNAKLTRKMNRNEGYRNNSNSQHSRHNHIYELKELIYSPQFDRYADGVIDDLDVSKATQDMGQDSSQADQDISKAIRAGTYMCTATVTGYDWI